MQVVLRSFTISLGVVSLVLSPAELRARTYVVQGSVPHASDENPGTDDRPLKTINRGAQLAHPGDSVVVYGGVYRERVAPARGGRRGQPIIYTSHPGETVVIKGSNVWRPQWQKRSDNKPIYFGNLDSEIFAGERMNPYRTLLKGVPNGKRFTLGQLFVDGQPLREVDNEPDLLATSATWLVSKGAVGLTVHFPPGNEPPQERMLELTVRERIFAPHRRGLGYVHVSGFTLEHCANQFPDKFWLSDSPQAGALGCRAGHHWLIENNTVRFAKSIGIDCGYEGGRDLEGNQPTPRNTGHHLIRNNIVTDNGCCGIAGMRSTSTRIIGNVIERNNLNHHTAPEVGGIKVHYFVDGLIDANLIRDNDAHGIWVDNVYTNARVTRNLVIGNRGDGIFVELGKGPILIDNNIIANTRPSFFSRDPRGDGMYSHDASGVNFFHNLVFGCARFGSFHLKVTERRNAGASRIKLLNNLFLDNKEGRINLPFPGTHAQDNVADFNLFGPAGDFVINPWGGNDRDSLVRLIESAIGRRPLLWNDGAPRLNLNEWRAISRWSSHSSEAEAAEARISDDLILTLDWGAAIHEFATTPLPELDEDYFGNPIRSQNALPGPLQTITPGRNEVSLWPRL